MISRHRLIVATLLIVAIIWLWWMLPVQSWIETFRNWILGLGMTGIVAFTVAYVVITIVLGPASALMLTAGLAYGAWGFPLVVGSATLAAAVTFLLGRYVARKRVTVWINKDPRLRSLNKAVSDEGWRVVALMRINPLLPWSLQNYLFSVTRIDFIPYVLATLFGVMPIAALFVYIGSLGHSTNRAGLLQWALVLLGLLTTFLVAWVIGKRAKIALAAHSIDDRSV